MKQGGGITNYEIILASLEKKARDCGLILYQFSANQYDVLEIRKRESGRYNCIGFYTMKGNVTNPKFYHRKLGTDTVGDHLFRVHGPVHPYGRGSESHLKGPIAHNQSIRSEKRVWKDLNFKSESLEDTLDILVKLIDRKLLLNQPSKHQSHDPHEMQ
jgi:hypothetical protein